MKRSEGSYNKNITIETSRNCFSDKLAGGNITIAIDKSSEDSDYKDYPNDMSSNKTEREKQADKTAVPIKRIYAKIDKRVLMILKNILGSYKMGKRDDLEDIMAAQKRLYLKQLINQIVQENLEANRKKKPPEDDDELLQKTRRKRMKDINRNLLRQKRLHLRHLIRQALSDRTLPPSSNMKMKRKIKHQMRRQGDLLDFLTTPDDFHLQHLIDVAAETSYDKARKHIKASQSSAEMSPRRKNTLLRMPFNRRVMKPSPSTVRHMSKFLKHRTNSPQAKELRHTTETSDCGQKQQSSETSSSECTSSPIETLDSSTTSKLITESHRVTRTPPKHEHGKSKNVSQKKGGILGGKISNKHHTTNSHITSSVPLHNGNIIDGHNKIPSRGRNTPKAGHKATTIKDFKAKIKLKTNNRKLIRHKTTTSDKGNTNDATLVTIMSSKSSSQKVTTEGAVELTKEPDKSLDDTEHEKIESHDPNEPVTDGQSEPELEENLSTTEYDDTAVTDGEDSANTIVAAESDDIEPTPLNEDFESVLPVDVNHKSTQMFIINTDALSKTGNLLGSNLEDSKTMHRNESDTMYLIDMDEEITTELDLFDLGSDVSKSDDIQESVPLEFYENFSKSDENKIVEREDREGLHLQKERYRKKSPGLEETDYFSHTHGTIHRLGGPRHKKKQYFRPQNPETFNEYITPHTNINTLTNYSDGSDNKTSEKDENQSYFNSNNTVAYKFKISKRDKFSRQENNDTEISHAEEPNEGIQDVQSLENIMNTDHQENLNLKINNVNKNIKDSILSYEFSQTSTKDGTSLISPIDQNDKVRSEEFSNGRESNIEVDENNGIVFRHHKNPVKKITKYTQKQENNTGNLKTSSKSAATKEVPMGDYDDYVHGRENVIDESDTMNATATNTHESSPYVTQFVDERNQRYNEKIMKTSFPRKQLKNVIFDENDEPENLTHVDKRLLNPHQKRQNSKKVTDMSDVTCELCVDSDTETSVSNRAEPLLDDSGELLDSSLHRAVVQDMDQTTICEICDEVSESVKHKDKPHKQGNMKHTSNQIHSVTKQHKTTSPMICELCEEGEEEEVTTKASRKHGPQSTKSPSRNEKHNGKPHSKLATSIHKTHASSKRIKETTRKIDTRTKRMTSTSKTKTTTRKHKSYDENEESTERPDTMFGIDLMEAKQTTKEKLAQTISHQKIKKTKSPKTRTQSTSEVKQLRVSQTTTTVKFKGKKSTTKLYSTTATNTIKTPFIKHSQADVSSKNEFGELITGLSELFSEQMTTYPQKHQPGETTEQNITKIYTVSLPPPSTTEEVTTDTLDVIDLEEEEQSSTTESVSPRISFILEDGVSIKYGRASSPINEISVGTTSERAFISEAQILSESQRFSPIGTMSSITTNLKVKEEKTTNKEQKWTTHENLKTEFKSTQTGNELETTAESRNYENSIDKHTQKETITEKLEMSQVTSSATTSQTEVAEENMGTTAKPQHHGVQSNKEVGKNKNTKVFEEINTRRSTATIEQSKFTDSKYKDTEGEDVEKFMYLSSISIPHHRTTTIEKEFSKTQQPTNVHKDTDIPTSRHPEMEKSHTHEHTAEHQNRETPDFLYLSTMSGAHVEEVSPSTIHTQTGSKQESKTDFSESAEYHTDIEKNTEKESKSTIPRVDAVFLVTLTEPTSNQSESQETSSISQYSKITSNFQYLQDMAKKGASKKKHGKNHNIIANEDNVNTEDGFETGETQAETVSTIIKETSTNENEDSLFSDTNKAYLSSGPTQSQLELSTEVVEEISKSVTSSPNPSFANHVTPEIISSNRTKSDNENDEELSVTNIKTNPAKSTINVIPEAGTKRPDENSAETQLNEKATKSEKYETESNTKSYKAEQEATRMHSNVISHAENSNTDEIDGKVTQTVVTDNQKKTLSDVTMRTNESRSSRKAPAEEEQEEQTTEEEGPVVPVSGAEQQEVFPETNAKASVGEQRTISEQEKVTEAGTVKEEMNVSTHTDRGSPAPNNELNTSLGGEETLSNGRVETAFTSVSTVLEEAKETGTSEGSTHYNEEADESRFTSEVSVVTQETTAANSIQEPQVSASRIPDVEETYSGTTDIVTDITKSIQGSGSKTDEESETSGKEDTTSAISKITASRNELTESGSADTDEKMEAITGNRKTNQNIETTMGLIDASQQKTKPVTASSVEAEDATHINEPTKMTENESEQKANESQGNDDGTTTLIEEESSGGAEKGSPMDEHITTKESAEKMAGTIATTSEVENTGKESENQFVQQSSEGATIAEQASGERETASSIESEEQATEEGKLVIPVSGPEQEEVFPIAEMPSSSKIKMTGAVTIGKTSSITEGLETEATTSNEGVENPHPSSEITEGTERHDTSTNPVPSITDTANIFSDASGTAEKGEIGEQTQIEDGHTAHFKTTGQGSEVINEPNASSPVTAVTQGKSSDTIVNEETENMGKNDNIEHDNATFNVETTGVLETDTAKITVTASRVIDKTESEEFHSAGTEKPNENEETTVPDDNSEVVEVTKERNTGTGSNEEAENVTENPTVAHSRASTNEETSVALGTGTFGTPVSTKVIVTGKTQQGVSTYIETKGEGTDINSLDDNIQITEVTQHKNTGNSTSIEMQEHHVHEEQSSAATEQQTSNSLQTTKAEVTEEHLQTTLNRKKIGFEETQITVGNPKMNTATGGTEEAKIEHGSYGTEEEHSIATNFGEKVTETGATEERETTEGTINSENLRPNTIKVSGTAQIKTTLDEESEFSSAAEIHEATGGSTIELQTVNHSESGTSLEPGTTSYKRFTETAEEINTGASSQRKDTEGTSGLNTAEAESGSYNSNLIGQTEKSITGRTEGEGDTHEPVPVSGEEQEDLFQISELTPKMHEENINSQNPQKNYTSKTETTEEQNLLTSTKKAGVMHTTGDTNKSEKAVGTSQEGVTKNAITTEIGTNRDTNLEVMSSEFVTENTQEITEPPGSQTEMNEETKVLGENSSIKETGTSNEAATSNHEEKTASVATDQSEEERINTENDHHSTSEVTEPIEVKLTKGEESVTNKDLNLVTSTGANDRTYTAVTSEEVGTKEENSVGIRISTKTNMEGMSTPEVITPNDEKNTNQIKGGSEKIEDVTSTKVTGKENAAELQTSTETGMEELSESGTKGENKISASELIMSNEGQITEQIETTGETIEEGVASTKAIGTQTAESLTNDHLTKSSESELSEMTESKHVPVVTDRITESIPEEHNSEGVTKSISNPTSQNIPEPISAVEQNDLFPHTEVTKNGANLKTAKESSEYQSHTDNAGTEMEEGNKDRIQSAQTIISNAATVETETISKSGTTPFIFLTRQSAEKIPTGDLKTIHNFITTVATNTDRLDEGETSEVEDTTEGSGESKEREDMEDNATVNDEETSLDLFTLTENISHAKKTTTRKNPSHKSIHTGSQRISTTVEPEKKHKHKIHQSKPLPIYIELPVYPSNANQSMDDFVKYYSNMFNQTEYHIPSEKKSFVIVLEGVEADNFVKLNGTKWVPLSNVTNQQGPMPKIKIQFMSAAVTSNNIVANAERDTGSTVNDMTSITSPINDREETQAGTSRTYGVPRTAFSAPTEGTGDTSDHILNTNQTTTELHEIRITTSTVTNLSLEGTQDNPEKSTEASSSLVGENDKDNTGKECKESDFLAGKNNCFCSVDSVINSLKSNLKGKSGEDNIILAKCPSFVKMHSTINIDNTTEPHVRRKRSHLFFKSPDLNKEISDVEKIVRFFNTSEEVHSSDNETLALVGEKVKMPCVYLNEVQELSDIKFVWTFGSSSKHVTDHKVQDADGSLVFEKVSLRDGGNYTCHLRPNPEKSYDKGTYAHELSLVAIPVYKVKTTTLYNMGKDCTLADGDILHTYLPKIMDELLCGKTEKLCKIEVLRPTCLVHHDMNKTANEINVTSIVTMHELKNITPIDSHVCNINCQISTFTKMLEILMTNVKMVDGLPIRSSVGKEDVVFKPKYFNKTQDRPASSKLVIGCPPGYGIKKPLKKICFACPPNMYKSNDHSYCKPCPVGQYQTLVGAKSCNKCSSPLEDPNCLKVLYANTEYFAIYVAVAFSIVVGVILLILYCTRMDNDGEEYSNSRKLHSPDETYFIRRRRQEAALEHEIEPLLSGSRRGRGHPPAVPPPDFMTG